MAGVLIVLLLLWVAAAVLLVAIHGRYWRRVHQSRALWALLLVGSAVLPVDAPIARAVVTIVLGAFFVIAARPAVRARRTDFDLRRDAEREARGETGRS